jgi:hypothetical protein
MTCWAGFARFYCYNIPKQWEIYHITIKYTKWSEKYTKIRKIDQTAINIPTSSIASPSRIYPNEVFWFQNVPSGNPVGGQNMQHGDETAGPGGIHQIGRESIQCREK